MLNKDFFQISETHYIYKNITFIINLHNAYKKEELYYSAYICTYGNIFLELNENTSTWSSGPLVYKCWEKNSFYTDNDSGIQKLRGLELKANTYKEIITLSKEKIDNIHTYRLKLNTNNNLQKEEHLHYFFFQFYLLALSSESNNRVFSKNVADYMNSLELIKCLEYAYTNDWIKDFNLEEFKEEIKDKENFRMKDYPIYITHKFFYQFRIEIFLIKETLNLYLKENNIN